MQIPSTFYLLTGLSILLLSLHAIQQSLNNSISDEQLTQFESWTKQFHKKYSESLNTYRLHIFTHNLREIKLHNMKAQAGQQSYFMGLNQFSDLSDRQWAALYIGIYEKQQQKDSSPESEYKCSDNQPSDKDLPQALDWAAKAALTSVRDQGMCSGSDYAFTAVEAIQSARFISKGKLIQLSAQQLIDCSQSYGNRGCIAGNMTYSYAYLVKFGVTTETKYPYRGFAYNCSYNSSLRQADILGCVHVTPHKQISIKAAVRRQPIAASINALKLKSYAKGVYDTSGHILNQCKKDPNHWMLMVGWGRDESAKKDYWKLKNSWGTTWGEQGFFYIVRKADGQGQCGVQSELYFPIA